MSRDGAFVCFCAPGGDPMYKPVLAGAGESGAVLEAALHWVAVTLLDTYEARRFLREGMVVIDAGANTGSFALLAAGLVGPSGRVVAIEPVPDNALCLQKGAQATGIDNVRIVGGAVGDRPGALRLNLSTIRSSKHSGVTDVRARGGCLDVPQYTIDQLADELQLPAVDFLKIDVEGSELDALRGAQRVIKAHRPVIVANCSDFPEFRDLVPRLIAETAPDYSISVRSAAPGLVPKCFAVPRERLSAPVAPLARAGEVGGPPPAGSGA